MITLNSEWPERLHLLTWQAALVVMGENDKKPFILWDQEMYRIFNGVASYKYKSTMEYLMNLEHRTQKLFNGKDAFEYFLHHEKACGITWRTEY